MLATSFPTHHEADGCSQNKRDACAPEARTREGTRQNEQSGDLTAIFDESNKNIYQRRSDNSDCDLNS